MIEWRFDGQDIGKADLQEEATKAPYESYFEDRVTESQSWKDKAILPPAEMVLTRGKTFRPAEGTPPA